jgi:hypothetical protein
MKKRFLSPEERSLYRFEKFLSWFSNHYPKERVLFWTLTLPGGNRSLDVANAAKLWNGLNTNYISKEPAFFGWVRGLDVHEDGVPHFHVLVVTRRALSVAQVATLDRRAGAAAVRHGFGIINSLKLVYDTLPKACHYLTDYARKVAKEAQGRPEHLSAKKNFGASESLRNAHRLSGITKIHRNPKSRSKWIPRLGEGLPDFGKPRFGWLYSPSKTAAIFKQLAARRPQP